MAKPHEEDPELTGLFNRLENTRRERDMLKSQNHDMEVNLKVAESKVESLQHDVEKLEHQLEELRNSAIRDETVIKTIASTLVDHIQEERDRKQSPMPKSVVRGNIDDQLRALDKSIAYNRPVGDKNERP